MATIGYSLSALATAMKTNMTNIASSLARIVGLENGKVNKTQKVNGHALAGDITITKANVGLGSVPDYPATSSVSDASNAKFATAGAVKVTYDKAVSVGSAATSALNSHVSNKGNPHTVTKAQVGLSNVPNYVFANSVSDAATNKFASTGSVKVSYDKAVAVGAAATSALASHTNNKSNPHAVTKAQVGLSNVPNYVITGSTADASDAKFSTAGAVKKAYDLANSKITKAQGDGYYALKSHTHDTLTTKTIEDWNATNISNGFIQGVNRPNNPTGGWVWGLNMQHSGGYGMQVVTSNGGNNFYIRSRTDDGSGTWGKIYTNISKPSPSEIGAVAKAVLDGMFPVGHILLSTNSANPATYGYVGTWALLENDASLHTTTGSGVGTYTGSNTPAVPVPLHSHSAKITPSGEHTHQQTVSRPNDWNWGAGDNITAGSDDGKANSNSTNRTREAGHHTHPVSIENAGTSGATLDVRGRRFMVYAWRRTS